MKNESGFSLAIASQPFVQIVIFVKGVKNCYMDLSKLLHDMYYMYFS